MDVKNVNEKILLQKAQKFDEDALSEIYDIYSPLLYRYAIRLLGDQLLAEDCVSETFHRFLRQLREGFGPKDFLQSYLYRTAHNWIADFYRRCRLDNEEMNENIPSSETSVEDQVFDKIHAAQVRRALLSLTSEQQQVIVLKYLEGWQNEDIACLLKKNNLAVRALAFRALQRLRKELAVMERPHGIQE